MQTGEVLRTADSRFDALDDWPYAPHYIEFEGLRQHYVDEGPRDAKVALMLHGEPTWSYLYRKMMPKLLAAGYRCIAPDHLGFGRSDKPTNDGWFVIRRHYEALRNLIETLDLHNITIFVHDWGGPIGLRQVVDMPERFSRVVIQNTWLHDESYVYAPKIMWWRQAATDPAQLGGDMPTGQIVSTFLLRPGHDLAHVKQGYDAPFPDASYKAGARRFPFLLPFAEPVLGEAAAQAETKAKLRELVLPIHVVFSDADELLSAESGRAWAATLKNGSFDAIPGAGHFVPEEAGEEVAAIVLDRIKNESSGDGPA